MTIFANKTGPTTVRHAFNIYAPDVHRLAIVSPFFSYSKLLEEFAKEGRVIDVIVRLGTATPALELRNSFELPNVRIRFYTSRHFHSKLYIFGDRRAIVGSANFTESGMQSNREIAIEVNRDQPDFDELVSLFEEYWAEADVLNESGLAKYEAICSAVPAPSPDSNLDKKIQDAFGDTEPSHGIQRGTKKVSSQKTYLEDYKRTYQEFHTAYREVEDIYKGDGRRQQPDLPLRIEIDQFFSYIRQEFAPGDIYLKEPLRSGIERRSFMLEKIDAWFGQRWDWLDGHILEVYPQIQSRLGTSGSIEKASMNEIIDALEVCHAFHDRLRFYTGGIETIRKEFSAANDLNKVQSTLIYLLHGKGDFIERMGAVIFEPKYKLAMMGRSIVQELLGWVNNEDIPICNSRTIKSLRFLGFDLSE
ncbi:MAG: phospholipase D-like domain-containing protein [Thermoleophilia bacterium]